ncbi:hypothetical protein H2200_000085 [Cladophialophora chaetospira]|uniref:Uncharacterized protein n=1 Tax=Cladophialophora chaetospira TaxID=386627 RepID=A0AA38XMX2_9EURO|nr:hypothetical protein H2200_000085 [Cladophialophora chaetospira]
MPPKKAVKGKAKKDDPKLPSRNKNEDKAIATDQEQTKEMAAEEEAEADNNKMAEEPEPYPESKANQPQAEAEAEEKANGESQDKTNAHAGQKRKEPPTKAAKAKPNAKAPRQGSRSSARNKDNPASPKQLLNFLLSADALPYCFPEDELDDAKQSKTYKCYSLTSPTSLTPFEHLICSHLLSKPLSHKLGMRSIRTLLNKPFNFNSAEAVAKAGEKRVWEALEAARTQHRQKTATYIFGTAESYADSETMFKLADEANKAGPQGVIEHIKSTVPGLGQIGGEIFCRRIQCVDGWGDALWPYADSKSIDALNEIGIPVKDAEDLQSAIEREVNWDKVGDMGLHERDLSRGNLVGEDEETQVQAEFVVALERAVGCVLEGKVKELREAAAKA